MVGNNAGLNLVDGDPLLDQRRHQNRSWRRLEPGKGLVPLGRGMLPYENANEPGINCVLQPALQDQNVSRASTDHKRRPAFVRVKLGPFTNHIISRLEFDYAHVVPALQDTS